MSRPFDPPPRASGCGCLIMSVIAALAIMGVAAVALIALIPTAAS